MEESKIKKEVWQTIQSINKCWTGNDLSKLENLNDYFHETMVAITPTDNNRIEGRDACVAGWKSFAESAKIHSWKEIDPEVQLYGNDKFAVVTYYFDMSYDMGGQTINMGGRDMFVLVNEDGKWWVIADQFSAYPWQ